MKSRDGSPARVRSFILAICMYQKKTEERVVGNDQVLAPSYALNRAESSRSQANAELHRVSKRRRGGWLPWSEGAVEEIVTETTTSGQEIV
jgi:hypothetical protein